MATALHVGPHPDHESIGAVATLLALRHAKHEVINLACSLGRLELERRRRELEPACQRRGFEVSVLPPPLRIPSGDDLAVAQRALATTAGRSSSSDESTSSSRPARTTATRVRDWRDGPAGGALRGACAGPAPVTWGLAADSPHPHPYVGFDDDRMARAIHVLEGTTASSQRNDYRGWCAGRAEANRVLGLEGVSAGAPGAATARRRARRRGDWRDGRVVGEQCARVNLQVLLAAATARRCASAGGWTRRTSPTAKVTESV